MLEITVSTPQREILVDITRQVQSALAGGGAPAEGVLHIWVPHTTAGVTVNEAADPSVARDLVDVLARLIPRDDRYRHREGNADAHVKATLVGNHLAVPLVNGRLRLGTWQGIFLAEFDGPRTRRVWMQPVAAVPPGPSA